LQQGQLGVVELFVVVYLALPGDLGQFSEVIAIKLHFDFAVSDGLLQFAAGLL
jgi:hypothetical protein